MKISIFGTGYVGLVHAVTLAEIGHQVICIDIDEFKISELTKGIIPFYEPDLQNLVHKHISNGNLKFSINQVYGIKTSDVIFIAVGTPANENGSADLSAIIEVAKSIGQHITNYKLIVIKSTVPVGTTEFVHDIIHEQIQLKSAQVVSNVISKSDAHFEDNNQVTTVRNNLIQYDVISNPEFLKEGNAIKDSLSPERIIIGSNCGKAFGLMRQIYKYFIDRNTPFLEMDIRSAELTKYAANCMLATKISFINEMARLAQLFGADIDKIKSGIGTDSRIGHQFINPGCGFGGSCFPKDIDALINLANKNNFKANLLEAVKEVNSNQKLILFRKVQSYFKHNLTGKNFAIWGVAFKPNTDDIREAPSLILIEKLIEQGANCILYDPIAMPNAKLFFNQYKNVTFVQSKFQALKAADALIICTEWDEFKLVNIDEIINHIKNPIIFDGRNIFKLEEVNKKPINYISIGRTPVFNIDPIRLFK